MLGHDGDGLRPAIALAMLVGASVLDWRSRRVPNLYWFPFGAMALVFVLSDLAQALAVQADFTAASPRLVRFATVYAVASAASLLYYLFWRLRLFGGADYKALAVLSFLAPWPFADAASLIPPSLQAVAVGSLLVALSPLLFLAVNAARGDLAFPAMLLGTRIPMARARRRQVWAMQDVEDGRLAWRHWGHVGTTRDERLDRLERAGLDRVWVTPRVAMIIPLALGFAVAWWIGDPFGALARLLAA